MQVYEYARRGTDMICAKIHAAAAPVRWRSRPPPRTGI